MQFKFQMSVNPSVVSHVTEGYVYIIYPCQFKLTSAPIYKVGRSSNVHKRLRQYGGNSEIICSQKVPDMYEGEKVLLQSFRIHFKSENAIGNEYFSGDILKMRELFDLTTVAMTIEYSECGVVRDGIELPKSQHTTEKQFLLTATRDLWAKFFDEHFPIDTEVYIKSTSLIMKHTAFEIDYFIRNVYIVQSALGFGVRSEDSKFVDEIHPYFRDLDKFKTLKNALPTLKRLKMLQLLLLSNEHAGISSLSKLSIIQCKEITENERKLILSSSVHIDATEAIMNIMKRIGLRSPFDFETEFTSDDIVASEANIADITHIRDKLVRWHNRTKIPSSLKGVFSFVIYDLFGLTINESSRRRVKDKQPTKRIKKTKADVITEHEAPKSKGAPRFQFYKLALDQHIDQMFNLTNDIVVSDEQKAITVKTTEPAETLKPKNHLRL